MKYIGAEFRGVTIYPRNNQTGSDIARPRFPETNEAQAGMNPAPYSTRGPREARPINAPLVPFGTAQRGRTLMP